MITITTINNSWYFIDDFVIKPNSSEEFDESLLSFEQTRDLLNAQNNSRVSLSFQDKTLLEQRLDVLDGKVSAGELKTINGVSLLGSGDITVGSARATTDLESACHVSGGDITILSGTNFSISAGVGYARNPSGDLVRITWDAVSTIATQYDGANYVGFDYNSQPVFSTQPLSSMYCPVGYVFTTANNTVIIGFASVRLSGKDALYRLGDLFRNTIGTLVESGVSTAMKPIPEESQLVISQGTVWYLLNKYEISQTDQFTKLYQNAEGFGVDPRDPNTINVYDYSDVSLSGNSLINMSVGYYKKDMVVVTPSNNAYYIYATSQWPTIEEAKEAPLPDVPDSIRNGVVRSAALIIEQSTPGAIEVLDIRPIFTKLFDGGFIASNATVINHSDLAATVTTLINNRITDQVIDGDTVTAPTQNAVFDLVATKANLTHTHPISDVTGLSTVLANKADVSHTHTSTQITDFTSATRTAVVDDAIVDGVTNKAPSQNAVFDSLANKANLNHTHVVSQITDYTTTTDARIATYVSNTSIDALNDVDTTGKVNGQVLTYNTTTSQWVPTTPVVYGDMFKSTYDTTNNGVVDNSERLNNQLPAFYLSRNNHTGTQPSSTISDFTTTVDTRINSRIQDQIVDGVTLNAPSQNAVFDALSNKSNLGHNHSIAEITNLQTTLDNKSNTNHTHTSASITDFDVAVRTAVVEDQIIDGVINKAPSQNSVFDALANKANSIHTHSSSQITDFNASVDSRINTRISNTSIDELNDVNTTNKSNGQVLTYNSVTSQWSPATPIVYGDMFKSTYDTNDNGVIDNSERLNNQLPTYYLSRSNHTGTQDVSTITGLTKAEVGLSNVDNTSDLNKPISTATQTALNNKENTIPAGLATDYVAGDKTIKPLNTNNVSESIDKRFVTDAQRTVLQNTSGVNSGDETTNTIKTKLGVASTTTEGYLTSTSFNTFNNKEPALPLGTSSQYFKGDKTLATLDKNAVGLGNVPNYDFTTETLVNNAKVGISSQQAFDIVAANDHRAIVAGNPHKVTKTDVGLSNVPNTDFTTSVNNADAHITTLAGNPHNVTKADVGLGNVQNVDTTNASNITTGILPSSVLPPIAITDTYVVTSEVNQLALTVQKGDIAVRTDEHKSYINTTGNNSAMSDWQELMTPTDTVLSVNGQTNTVVLLTTHIGEGTSLYYTDARVSANADVAANTANRHNHANRAVIDGSTASFTTEQAEAIIVNSSKVGISLSQVDIINDASVHISTLTGNPHQVTKVDVGLGNVPNHDFTSEVEANSAKIGITTEQAAAIVDNTAHRNTISGNPHNVTKADIGLSAVVNTDFTLDVASATTHVATIVGNPHNVTKADVGLSLVPNRDFTTDIDSAYLHINTISGNPHQVTKNDVGLSQVPNHDFTAEVNANTAKIGITAEQAAAIVANTAKVGITVDQAAIINQANIHINTTAGNPHNVTKADVGLGNVQNVDTTNAANITSGRLPLGGLEVPLQLLSDATFSNDTVLMYTNNRFDSLPLTSSENNMLFSYSGSGLDINAKYGNHPNNPYFSFMEHFVQPSVSPYFLRTANSGTTAALSLSSDTDTRMGVLRLGTGTLITSGVALGTSGMQSFNFASIPNGGYYETGCRFQLPTLSDATQTFSLVFGFGDATTAQPVDGVFLRHTTNTVVGRLVANSVITDIAIPNITNLEINTDYILKIRVSRDNSGLLSATFKLNGNEVTTSSGIPTGVARQTALQYAIIKSDGLAERVVDLDWIYFERYFPEISNY